MCVLFITWFVKEASLNETKTCDKPNQKSRYLCTVLDFAWVCEWGSHTHTRTHIAKVLYTHAYISRRSVGYSPTIDLSAIGSCQGRDIELDRRVGAFQAVRLVQLLHNVPHFPIAFEIGYRVHLVLRDKHWHWHFGISNFFLIRRLKRIYFAFRGIIKFPKINVFFFFTTKELVWKILNFRNADKSLKCNFLY